MKMSFSTNWDIDRYREEHESDEHWELRRAFMARWKDEYPEERLICLARVFANIEFMGCKYPLEIMKEVSRLSEEVAKSYRSKQKSKLQRTFVSASDAAEDRAKGVKRQAGVIVGGPSNKNTKINFVPQGHKTVSTNDETIEISGSEDEDTEPINKNDHDSDINDLNINKNEQNRNLNQLSSHQNENGNDEIKPPIYDYMEDMKKINCIDVRCFNESMFNTAFGRLVLMIRPWASMGGNIQASCQSCKLLQNGQYVSGEYSITINNKIVAKTLGGSKQEAKSICDTIAWDKLRKECISIVFKEKYIAQGDTKITCDDVSSTRERKNMENAFGTPIESNVATKMMKLMGWTGGGLGADAQGISEPIKPHLQMVNRTGLGNTTSDINQMKRAGLDLMRRFSASECFDVDLVFSSEFSKEERAALHQIAGRCGLASTSYGKGEDRFLVVKKKLDPFSLVRAVIEKGGETPKYKVFIPEMFYNRRR